MRTKRNWSLIQMFTNGMVHIRNRSRTGSIFVADDQIDDLEWLWSGCTYANWWWLVDVDSVKLPNIDLDVVSHIDSVSYYDSFCIDIYEQALALINEGMYYKLTFRCISTHNCRFRGFVNLNSFIAVETLIALTFKMVIN